MLSSLCWRWKDHVDCSGYTYPNHGSKAIVCACPCHVVVPNGLTATARAAEVEARKDRLVVTPAEAEAERSVGRRA